MSGISSLNISASSERKKAALSYLSEEVRSAHNEGDGVLVNHLCTIAVEQIGRWIKEGLSDIRVSDVHWALVMPLYWLVDEYMLFPVSEVIKNLQPKNKKEEELLRVLKSVFCLVEQSLDDSAKVIEELIKSKPIWVKYQTECEDSALLTLAVELVWWRNPEGENWLTLLNAWSNKLEALVKANLSNLFKRLVLQTSTLYPRFKFDKEKSPLNELEPIAQDLYQAWESFLDCDYETLDKILRRMVGAISFESSHSLPVFYLHHFTRIQRKNSEAELAGLTRRRLQISSRKEALFVELRNLTFYKKLQHLWRDETPSKGATERFHCFRLAMLNQITALRAWDLASWFEAINQQHDAIRELLRFGNQDYAIEFSIRAVQLSALSRSFKKEDGFFNDAVQTIDKAPEESREMLILSLISMRRFMWPSVLDALSLISDAIPEKLFSPVAEWCVNYVNNPIQPFGSETSDALSLWTNIISYTPHSENICVIIHPIALKVAKTPLSWRSAYEALIEYMINAHSDLAIEVGEKMFEVQIKDENFNSQRWEIIFRASLGHPELSQKFKKQLSATAKTPLLEFRLPLLPFTDKRFQLTNEEEFRNWCREQVLSLSKEIIDRKSEKKAFGPGFNPRVLVFVDWPKLEKDLITAALTAIKASFVQNHEISALVICLAELIFRGQPTNIELIREDFFQWLNELPAGKRMTEKELGGPLSTFHMAFPGPEDIFVAFCHLVTAISTKDKARVGEKVTNWLLGNIFHSPIRANAQIFYLISLLGIVADFISEIDVVSSIQMLIMKAIQIAQKERMDYRSLERLLNRIAVLLRPDSKEPASLSKAVSNDRKLLLFKTLSSWVPGFVNHNAAEVRARIAEILIYWKDHEELKSEFQELLEKLQSDPRARVRYSASFSEE